MKDNILGVDCVFISCSYFVSTDLKGIKLCEPTTCFVPLSRYMGQNVTLDFATNKISAKLLLLFVYLTVNI